MGITMDMIDGLVGKIQEQIVRKPRICIILGSGLGDLASAVDNPTIIPYSDLSGWPLPTVIGHSGRLLIGALEGQDVITMQGRVHFYEGYTIQQVALPVRVIQKLGVEILFVTNAAGAINSDFIPGDVMLITDNLNLMGMCGVNPL